MFAKGALGIEGKQNMCSVSSETVSPWQRKGQFVTQKEYSPENLNLTPGDSYMYLGMSQDFFHLQNIPK